MVCLFEGSTEIDSIRYPNKISTYKSKKFLGDYLRYRLGLEKGVKVTAEDFSNYGRDNITISKINEGSYYFELLLMKFDTKRIFYFSCSLSLFYKNLV